MIPYDMFEKCSSEEKGECGTLDWRMYFKTTGLDGSDSKDSDPEDLDKVSIWHDIPLVFSDPKDDGIYLNYVNEIAKGDRAKMECATKEAWHPIKQDVKKEKLRFFTYGDLPFNYGMLPQTWEDPEKKSKFTDVDTLGDNDPVDVVELSDTPMKCGAVTPVKVLGILGLIDEGETDWKVLAIRKDHPKADKLNDVGDVDKVLGEGTCDKVVHWFQYYKTTDGKPENLFAHGGKLLDKKFAMDVIDETHQHWMDFLLNKVESKLERSSVTYNVLKAQGVTSDEAKMVIRRKLTIS